MTPKAMRLSDAAMKIDLVALAQNYNAVMA